jgi:hypothetical protein
MITAALRSLLRSDAVSVTVTRTPWDGVVRSVDGEDGA